MNINPENGGAAARIYHDSPCAGSWHKFFHLAGFVLFSLFLAFAATGCKKQANEITARDIEVIRVERRQATIAWTTGDAFQGEVFYRTAAGGNTAKAVKETLSKSFHHQVVLTNLKPGTRYTYWIDNPEKRYQFQTRPEANTPFSFIMGAKGDPEMIRAMVMNEVPDFIIDAGPVPEKGIDPFHLVRPYVPIFDHFGPKTKLRGGGKRPQPDLWCLDWGELHLWISNAPDFDRRPLPEFNKPGLQGLLLARGMAGVDAKTALVPQSPLHNALVRHNRHHTSRPVMFVLVKSAETWHKTMENIAYVGLPMGTQQMPGVRIDVGRYQANAVFLDTHKKIELKAPPLEGRISCDDCRKLADQGAYDTAIKAYKTFIQNHDAGHFQIDDAYFATARLYDEKLFDYPSAIHWYQRLIKKEPNSGLTPLARQRVKFLQHRSDFDYEPLARFEKIKTTQMAGTGSTKEAVVQYLEQARAIVDQYPAAVVAPSILHWLGMAYRDIDTNLAVAAFERLSKHYPNSAEAATAGLDIGDTYYDAGIYDPAIKAYEKALARHTGMSQAIAAKIQRSKRNIRRDTMGMATFALVCLAPLFIVLMPPKGVYPGAVRRAAWAFPVIFGVNFLGAWVIHEQFISTLQMVELVFGFSLAAVWGGAAGGVLTAKIKTPGSGAAIVRGLAGLTAGLAVFISAGYLAVYIVYEHYLIVIHM
ncbi:MAG: tetratricopeptide repeat protein [Desulfobacterales bacterium]|nr:tetratricopeptide repeat protein [Desulfobacterales bacterium]